MATELHAHDGAAARKAKEVWIHDGAAARKAKEVWIHDGTTARKVFSGDPQLQLANHTVSSVGGQSGYAEYEVKNNGEVIGKTYVDSDQSSVSYAPEWASGTFDTSVTGLYEVLFTYVSGTNSNGGSTNTGFFSVSGTAYGSWNPLSTSRFRGINRSAGTLSGGTASCTFDVSIRKIGTTSPVATARITISAQGIPV